MMVMVMMTIMMMMMIVMIVMIVMILAAIILMVIMMVMTMVLLVEGDCDDDVMIFIVIIFFQVNTLQLCGKLINVVEGPSSGIMDDLQQYPVCDVVMYKYYLGRLKMFEDRYNEARYV